MATLSPDSNPALNRNDKAGRNDGAPGEINIGDLLRLALPLDTALLGGGLEARRHVNWIAVLPGWSDVESQAPADCVGNIPPELAAGPAHGIGTTKVDDPAGLAVSGRLQAGSF